MAITRAEADRIAAAYLAELSVRSSHELVVLDKETIDEPFGWVFFYDSEEHLRTGSFLHALGGNAPFVVLRTSGGVHVLGTLNQLDEYLAPFRAGTIGSD